mgnify:CR=1 FL=1
MKIYVDADACPVTRIVERVAREHDIPVALLCDTNHVLSSDQQTLCKTGSHSTGRAETVTAFRH